MVSCAFGGAVGALEEQVPRGVQVGFFVGIRRCEALDSHYRYVWRRRAGPQSLAGRSICACNTAVEVYGAGIGLCRAASILSFKESLSTPLNFKPDQRLWPPSGHCSSSLPRCSITSAQWPESSDGSAVLAARIPFPILEAAGCNRKPPTSGSTDSRSGVSLRVGAQSCPAVSESANASRYAGSSNRAGCRAGAQAGKGASQT